MVIKVSVLVPIYCVENYIERCAESLFNQTYKNIEYVFVNDCTPDRSVELLKNVILKHPTRKDDVKIVNHNENKGLGEARNTAVKEATGDFILHVDSDDYLDPYCVSDCVKVQNETGADIVAYDQIKLRKGYQFREIKPDFTTPLDMTLCIIRRDCPNGVCSNFIRRSLYMEHNIKVEKGISMGEDLIVLPRLLYYSKIVANQHSSFYYYDNTNEKSYTSFFSEKKAQQVWDVIEFLESFFENKEEEYLKALNVRKLRVAAEQIKAASITGGQEVFVKDKLEMVEKLMPYYGENIDTLVRFGLRLKSMKLMKLYFRLASIIKTTLRKFKCI
jgi:glycosyltransferase involved in cell wall biosynthesis